MKKEEIINEETLYDYCLEKAKVKINKNWNLDEEDENIIDCTEALTFKQFWKLNANIKLNEEIENAKKYFTNSEEKINKILKKYKENTSIYIARLEFYLTSRIR